MSIITRAFRDHLKADSAVAAIVGTKVLRSWAEDAAPPYVIITKPSDVPGHHMTAADGLPIARVQVDCYETSRHKAETLSTAVWDALDGRPGGTIGNQNVVVSMLHMDDGPVELDEAPTDKGIDGEYRDSMDFLVAYRRAVPTFT